MSNWQSSLSAAEPPSYTAADTGSPVDMRVVVGLALLALGAALFAVGIFHGFQGGSCSTTGYSAHYGPVQHCGKGVGWWMLILTAGIFVAGAGAALAGTLNTLAIPVLFVAIGAPFVALALRGGNTHLLIGRSSGTGDLYAGVFGACFVIAGLVWGVIAGRSAVSGLSGSSRLAGLLGSVVGVAVALVIATGVAGAIGPATPTAMQQVGQSANRTSSSAGLSSAATGQAAHALEQATAQADKAEKLAACATAAGSDIAKIQRCEAKYTP